MTSRKTNYTPHDYPPALMLGDYQYMEESHGKQKFFKKSFRVASSQTSRATFAPAYPHTKSCHCNYANEMAPATTKFGVAA